MSNDTQSVPDSLRALSDIQFHMDDCDAGFAKVPRQRLAEWKALIAAQPAGQSEPPILRVVVEVHPDRTDTRLTFGERIRPEPGVKAVEQAIAALTAEYEARGGCPVVGRHPAGQAGDAGAVDAEKRKELERQIEFSEGCIAGKPGYHMAATKEQARKHLAYLQSELAKLTHDPNNTRTGQEKDMFFTSDGFSADLIEVPRSRLPAPNSTHTGAVEDLSAVRRTFERALPHSVKRFGEIAERFKPAPDSTRTGPAETDTELGGEAGSNLAPWLLSGTDEEVIEQLMRRSAGDVACLFFPTPHNVVDPIRRSYHTGRPPRQQRLLAALLRRLTPSPVNAAALVDQIARCAFYSVGVPNNCNRQLAEALIAGPLAPLLAARPEAPSDEGWRERAATEIDAIAQGWSTEGDADGRAYAKTIAAILRAESPTPPSDPAPSGQAEG